MLHQSMIQMKHQQILQQQILEVEYNVMYFRGKWLLYVLCCKGGVPIEQADAPLPARAAAQRVPAAPAGPAEETGRDDGRQPHQGEGEQVQT